MSWVFIDDRFFTNRKVMSVSLHARWLYLSSLCVASQQSTDGLLDEAAQTCLMVAVGRGGNFDQLAAELVRAGLWLDKGEKAFSMAAMGELWRFPIPRQYQKRPYLRHRTTVYYRDGRRCRYCAASSNLSLDHLLPPRMGGTHEPSNLVTCCRLCNSRKGSRTPEQAGMVLLSIEASS